MKKIGLNINQLKLIAAVSMLLDHVGYFLFPTVTVLRIIGRLAFPIFAFCISEGCRYTKNRLRYWLQMLVCAAVFQVVAFIAEGVSAPINIFGTFSVAILLCYLFDFIKSRKLGGFLLFGLAVFAVYALNRYLNFDYGFLGMLLPLSAYVFEATRSTDSDYASSVGRWAKFLCFSLTLLALAGLSGWSVQYFSIFAVPILSLYNGQYGSKKFKYWFYVFYPFHLVVIYFVGCNSWERDMLRGYVAKFINKILHR